MFGVRELNVSIELWGVAFCAVGIACAVFFMRSGDRYRNLFIAFSLLVLLASGGDALAGVFRGQAGSLAWTMTHLGNFVTFCANFLLLAAITMYLCSRIQEAEGPAYQAWRNGVFATAIAMCALALLGAFFYIDESNLYHRTSWYWVSSDYAVIVESVNVALTIRHRRKLGTAAFFCLLFYTLVPAAAAVAQVLVYGLNFAIIASVLGFVVVFLEMQSHTARTMIRQSEELALSQIEVSEGRIAVMVSQIQPHFLFNTLDTIYGLCDEDPQLSKKAIASFSRYLRTNLNSLNQTTPVPIEKEMEHVRTYLELERMSDEDRISYEFDLQAQGFSVPALSVQTLAENAVKHGLGGREQGGKVIIRTRERPGEYTVAIVDDGVGFAALTATHDRPHIGLDNTRARLAAMCNGTLTITSEPNVGSTAVMHIPKTSTGPEQ